jgi:DHA1 family bicyclomycin/chloramphenicol resistance-like MFS transporter
MQRAQSNLFILTLGALSAIGPFSIDMYLPAFPAISQSFETDIAHVGFTLTSYFVGISLGHMLYGPILDRYGRKKPLMIGLGIFIIAAIACALSMSLEWLIVNRFLMALGGCVGMVGGRAVVRDLFPIHETAHIFSTLMLFIGVAPIIAPTVGSLIVASFGWQWIFAILSLIALVVLGAFSLLIPESKAADYSISLRPRHVFREYFAVLREPTFITYAIAGGAASAALFAYISGGPFVFMKLFGFSEREFGLLFGANALSLITGSQINRRLLRRHSSAAITFAMAGLQFATGLILLIGTLLGFLHTAGTLILIFIFQFFGGFLFPNNSALALQPFTRNVGSASALLGSIQVIAAALSSGLVSFLNNGTALPMAAMMALCSFIGIGILSANRYTTRNGQG